MNKREPEEQELEVCYVCGESLDEDGNCSSCGETPEDCDCSDEEVEEEYEEDED